MRRKEHLSLAKFLSGRVSTPFTPGWMDGTLPVIGVEVLPPFQLVALCIPMHIWCWGGGVKSPLTLIKNALLSWHSMDFRYFSHYY